MKPAGLETSASPFIHMELIRRSLGFDVQTFMFPLMVVGVDSLVRGTPVPDGQPVEGSKGDAASAPETPRAEQPMVPAERV